MRFKTSIVRRALSPRAGFTLVELLVVIGIIALLMSILLPALNRARMQANTVKCATQMREIGNAFRYYASENRNFYPPAKLEPVTGEVYNINGFDHKIGTANSAFWVNFISKYVTKNNVGNAAGSGSEAVDTRNRSVLWGCPNFQAYLTAGASVTAGFNVVQNGYGMNAYPNFTPTANGSAIAMATPWSAATPGKGFVKATVWGKNGSERALVAESKYFVVWSGAPVFLARGGIAAYVEAQEGDLANQTTDPQSYVSFWRHGKMPANEGTGGAQKYAVWKGRPVFNVLYCDGHVSTSTDYKEGFKAIRLKFPN
jgi:prepilin-type N-terminal cleavage/methylation domain-containing protein/prepilin-type processing-associated H-X9-DG protein